MNGKTNELNIQICAPNKETALHSRKDVVQGVGGGGGGGNAAAG